MKPKTHLFAITILPFCTLLMMPLTRADANPYAFSVDRFEVQGNISSGTAYDEFNNGNLSRNGM